MATPANPQSAVFKDDWLPGPDGTQFYTRTYAALSSARAVVVFVHGFSGHCARYECMHGVYATRGITVFAFDQRGFGRTAFDAEAKTGKSFYGKTSWREQLDDIDWWVKHVKDQYPALPMFLMGHSMGGALALAFVTRSSEPPAKGTISILSGVIASSPFILRARPTAKHVRIIGWLLSLVFPNLVLHTPINPNNLSHDPVRNEANASDPRIIHKGSLRIMNDMLTGGEELLWNDYRRWPRSLPLVILHGNSDRVTSFRASEEFFGTVNASDKEFKPFENGYHELVNESNGMKEKFVDDCISWILKHA
ncbi:lysophospholipase [Lentinus brumalis]|uniref:Lysophospholipase n=1 Tax=Lentinus brumalis TaxID=2498619 RepID=A0A371CIA8_9APHY|nr:lysophospholipase [Polyporus brumalis]